MKTKKYNHGSLMIGTLIMMLLISATSIAIISRSKHGAILTTDAEKGYSAYQATDQVTEFLLNKIKTLDNLAGNKIPENSSYTDLCNSADVTCLRPNGDVVSAGSKVSDVYRIQSSATTNQGLTRKLQVDLGERIESGLDGSSLSVAKCGDGSGGCTYNQCDLKVSLTLPSDTSKIKDFEVRRSTSSDLGADPAGYGWQIAGEGSELHPLSTTKFSYILKNGDSYLASQGDSQYNKNYYFTIKARNKNPLSLDSLYLANGAGMKNISMPSSSSCTGSTCLNPNVLTGLGCSTDPGGNAETVKSTYVCCNGMDYYQCKSGLTKNGATSCENTRTCTCAAKPVNTIWNGPNSSGQYSEDFNGSGWPTSCPPSTVYDTNNVAQSCHYTCAANYTWNSGTGKCEASCNLPWGGTISSGQSATAYSTASVACGSSCVGQTRTCTDGVLSGSYANSSCAPNNPANYGQACSSAANTCGQTNSGTINCSGTCSATVPANPAGYGQACNSAANVCGSRNSGTITCSGACSATAPANPANYGQACTSSANACGQTNSGTINCSGTCSATMPANPANYGQACNSSANSCGQTNTGTYDCSGACSASPPSDSSCCHYELTSECASWSYWPSSGRWECDYYNQYWITVCP